ncbi:MAG: efflux RND transporter periplasmic adaptor subunit, partial [Bulleidia sp.]
MEQDRNDSLAELDGVVEMEPPGNSEKPGKKPEKKKRHLLRNLIILAVVIAAGFGGWKYYSAKQNSGSSETAAVVRTYTVTKQSLASTVVADGTIASQSTTNVTCSQNYNVESINVSVGDTVNEGDIIAVLDTSELEKQIARAVESDNESLETMAKNVQNALDAKEYAWSQQPQLSDYSDDQNQTAQEKYDAAYAEWAHNFASVNGNYFDLLDEYNDALENGVEDTNLEDLRESLAECTIAATASGTITEMNLTVGSAPNGTAAVISDLNNLQVSVYVDEYDIMNIKAGMSAVVTSDVVDGKEFAATVKSTSPVSSGSGYEVVVTLDDPT